MSDFATGKLYLATVSFSGRVDGVRLPPLFFRSVEAWLHSLTNRGPECRELCFAGELLRHAVQKMVDAVNRRFPDIDMYPRVHSLLPEHLGEWVWRFEHSPHSAPCNAVLTLTFPLTVFAPVDAEELRRAAAAEMRARGDDKCLTGMLFDDFIRRFNGHGRHDRPSLSAFDVEVKSSCWSFDEDEGVWLREYK